MEIGRALEILRALADGLDPSTAETAAKDSMLQEPDTVRALHLAITALERGESKQPTDSAKGGSGWSQEEDAQLCKEFHGSVDFADIANTHGRARSEIISRLVVLGKLKPKGNSREAA